MALTYGRSTRSSRSCSRRSRSRSRSCSHSRSHSRSRSDRSRSRSRSQSSRKHRYSASTTRYRTRKHRSRSPRRSPRNSSHHSSRSSQSISRTSRDCSAPCDRRRQSKEERAKQVAHQILVNQLMDPRKAPESDLYSKYNTQAGFILRGLHLFINIKNLFDHGLRSEGFDMTTAGVVVDDDDSEDEEEPRANSPAPSDHGSQDTQDDSCNPEVDVDGTAEPDDAPENDSFDVDAMYANLYRRLKEMIPELDDTMDRFKRDTRGLQLFIKQTAAAGGEDETGKDGDGGRGEDDPAQSNDESS
ncbi:hypothetical protein D9758_016470 [Tetrapyrgos nigripes]|uniref:Uncharacterized protein n=1 Tax=Tetrapyrgos nigripes TaxID=182062 RepID=A0A8H5CPA9_9AGAR|nr:hypothetical protein D9758_016470 [Tetrapyrgos nigripes]